MGNVKRLLSAGTYDPAVLPYAGRFVIEDCETVHLHMGNLRMEFTVEQFMDFAEMVETARRQLVRVG